LSLDFAAGLRKKGKQMGLSDLGKEIWRAARKNGKALWEELGDEVRYTSPEWDKIKSTFKKHGRQFSGGLGQAVKDWIEQESQRQGFSIPLLFGRDPKVERSYRLLSLPYGTEMEIVKQRWRDLLKESHPDRHMKDPKAYARATEKTQVLTSAYHSIAKAFEEGRV